MWESLPAEVFGGNVLCFLSLKDVVRLDSAILSWCGRKQFLQSLPYRPAFVLKSINDSILKWFISHQCRLKSLTISVHQALLLKNDLVEDVCLHIEDEIPVEIIDLKIKAKVRQIKVTCCNSLSFMLDLLKCFDQVYYISVEKVSCVNSISEWVRGSVELRGDIVAIHTYNGVLEGPLKFSISLKYISGITVRFQKIFMDCIPDMRTIAAASPQLRELRLLRYCQDNITDDVVTAMVSRCHLLENIHLASFTGTDRSVIAIAQHCPNLKSLEIKEGAYTHTSMKALSERGLPLESLSLPWMPIPHRDAHRCAYALSLLHRINLQNQQLIDREGLLVLARYCRALKEVDVRFVDSAAADVADAFIEMAHANSHSLRSITVYCMFTPHCFTNAQIGQLAQSCPHLKKLCLHDIASIQDTGILALSEHCPGLEFLYLTGTETGLKTVSEGALLRLVQGCSKLGLISLSATGVSNEAVDRILSTTGRENMIVKLHP